MPKSRRIENNKLVVPRIKLTPPLLPPPSPGPTQVTQPLSPPRSPFIALLPLLLPAQVTRGGRRYALRAAGKGSEC